MQKIIDPKTGKKVTVFNKYSLNGAISCPECGQILTQRDFTLLEQLGKRSCVKCGAILTK